MWKSILGLVSAAGLAFPAVLPDSVRFSPGPVNRVQVGSDVLIYGGAGGAKYVLLTTGRRDTAWAAEAAIRAGAEAIAPVRERSWLEQPAAFWQAFETQRFHDYSQQTTKVPRRPTDVKRWVQGGDSLDAGGFRFDVLNTPGYSPGAVTYLFTAGGKRIACTGDLIYEGGRLRDLYSLQNEIPETKTRGYHGYAARAGELLASLRRVAAAKPDILVPAYGLIIENPQQAIDLLSSRLTALLQSHFATDALRWYWGEESFATRSRVSGLLDGVRDVMPMAAEQELPDFMIPIENSRLLLSRSGAAFLFDAGYRSIVSELKRLQREGRFQKLEGIWVSHYHDDHTDLVQTAAQEFGAPVYFQARMRDILQNPGSYRMPCLTTSPIRGFDGVEDGRKLPWHEYEFQIFDFPGQTLYHDAVRIKPANGPALLLVGDSFTPSGIDDYCLQNRDFLREGAGYLYCLNLIAKLGSEDWIINQHVKPMFRFSAKQLDRMNAEMRKRITMVRELTPFPDPNYAVDESWARIYPYHVEAKAGERVRLEARIFNHAPREQEYRVRWNLPDGWKAHETTTSIKVPATTEGTVTIELQTLQSPGLQVITADIAFAEFDLHEWTEAMVRLK
jgi:glyoxylase-like metal-dependent hydrolase (beta-lactamase superfamily II)